MALNQQDDPEHGDGDIQTADGVRWPLCLEDEMGEPVKFPIRLPRREIEEADGGVRNQIAARDYTLVDSATHLVVCRPFYNGIQSQGASKEITRANDHMKKVIVYRPPEDVRGTTTSHPFESLTMTHDSEDAFFSDVERLGMHSNSSTA